MSITLRPYQREAIDAVHRAFAGGVSAPAVGLPTGTGKTIVFSQLSEERRPLGRTLILAHRDELLRQAAAKYREINPAVDVGFVQAGMNDIDHDVVIASVQSLSTQRRLDSFPFGLFATMIIDEAHHAVAPTYRRIIDRRAEGSLLLGVSATLERGDKVGLGEVWQEVVYLRTLQEMIAAGYLVDIRALRVRLNYNMGQLRTSRGDFVASEVSEMLEATRAYSVAAAAYLQHAQGRKAIIFVPTIKDAHSMAATFRHAGVTAEAVDGQMQLDDRRAVLARFASDETMVVANAMVLTEGFDEPSVGCIIVARPTKSRPLYVQMVGRGTRLYPGKEDLLVLDLMGNDERVDLQSLPKLFGLKADVLEKDGRGAVEYLGRGAHEIAGLFDPSQGIGADEVNLFERKDINWLKLSDGRWMLGLGDNDVYLQPRDGRWDAMLVPHKYSASHTALGVDLDIGYAMGVAEEYVRAQAEESLRLIDKTARWRTDSPSEKQTKLLGDLGIPITETMTKGEASNLIGAALAKRRGQRVS